MGVWSTEYFGRMWMSEFVIVKSIDSVAVEGVRCQKKEKREISGNPK